MKTMTCRELGGPCNMELSAETWEEMVKRATNHIVANHPETAEEMKKMHEADPEKWANEHRPKWEALAKN